MEGETSKADERQRDAAALRALFRHLIWAASSLALVLIVVSTWTQVVSPDYIGQAVDCYLFPQTTSNCWFDSTVQAAIHEQHPRRRHRPTSKLAGLGTSGR